MSPALTQAERSAELGAAVRWLVGLALLAALMVASQAGSARLVGYECEGAAGPIYAAEESDFPICGDIRPR